MALPAESAPPLQTQQQQPTCSRPSTVSRSASVISGGEGLLGLPGAGSAALPEAPSGLVTIDSLAPLPWPVQRPSAADRSAAMLDVLGRPLDAPCNGATATSPTLPVQQRLQGRISTHSISPSGGGVWAEPDSIGMLVPSALRGQSCTTSTGTDALVWTRCAGAPGASPCLLPQLSAPPSNVSSVHDILGIQSQEQLLLLEQQQQPQVPPHLLLPPAEQLPLQDAATQRAAPRPPPLIIPAAQQLHQGAGPLHYPHNSSLPQHESRAHQATAPTLQQQRARQRPPSSGAPTPSPALTGARTSVTPALRGMALADTPRSARASSAGGAEAGGEGGSQADDATLSNQLRRSRRLSSASSVVSSVAAATPSGGGVSALLAAGRQYVCVTCGALWGLLDVTDMSIFVCTAQEPVRVAPSAFEALAGKATARKWRTSLIVQPDGPDDALLSEPICLGDFIKLFGLERPSRPASSSGAPSTLDDAATLHAATLRSPSTHCQPFVEQAIQQRTACGPLPSPGVRRRRPSGPSLLGSEGGALEEQAVCGSGAMAEEQPLSAKRWRASWGAALAPPAMAAPECGASGALPPHQQLPPAGAELLPPPGMFALEGSVHGAAAAAAHLSSAAAGPPKLSPSSTSQAWSAHSPRRLWGSSGGGALERQVPSLMVPVTTPGVASPGRRTRPCPQQLQPHTAPAPEQPLLSPAGRPIRQPATRPRSTASVQGSDCDKAAPLGFAGGVTQLDVWCDALPGRLDLTRMQVVPTSGSHAGQPMSLSMFETLAGRGSARKWRRSVSTLDNGALVPLGDWLERHQLTVQSDGAARRGGSEAPPSPAPSIRRAAGLAGALARPSSAGRDQHSTKSTGIGGVLSGRTPSPARGATLALHAAAAADKAATRSGSLATPNGKAGGGSATARPPRCGSSPMRVQPADCPPLRAPPDPELLQLLTGFVAEDGGSGGAEPPELQLLPAQVEADLADLVVSPAAPLFPVDGGVV